MNEITSLTWTDPRSVTTRKGLVRVKSAEPNEGFWNLWKEHKQLLKDSGFSVTMYGGKYSVSWWENEGQFKMPVVPDLQESVVLPDLPPIKDSSNLFPYQPPLVAVAVWAMENFGCELNACDTGIGKTFITLAAIRERGRRVLVVCPKIMVPDWQDATKHMGVEAVGIYGWEWMKTGKTPFLKWSTKRVKKKIGGEWVLVDQRDKLVWDVPPDVDLVFDEAHRAAAPDTINSKMVRYAKDCDLPIHCLSATIADDPTKMRATGYVLGLHDGHKGFVDWMARHGVVETRFGPKFEGGQRHLLAIRKQIFPHKGVRMRKQDLGDAFPPTTILAKAYQIEESAEIDSAYQEMNSKIEELEAQEMDASTRQACILVEILRARQRVELLKIPLMVQLTKDDIEEGNSVFLAVNFKDTMQELIKHLNIQSVIMGGQKATHRKQMIDAFQNDEVRVIAGILDACREGISLHDTNGKYPRTSLIVPPQSPFKLRQVLGRINRAVKGGKGSPSIQRILFARDTIEEDVCKSLAKKLDQLDLIVDGDLNEGIFPNGYSSLRPKEEQESLVGSNDPF